MSTILKALRRLEEEKAEQDRPGLRESVVAASPATSRKLPLFFVLCGVFALGVAVMSWWQLRQLPAPQTPVATPLPVASPQVQERPAVPTTNPTVGVDALVGSPRSARSVPVQTPVEPPVASAKVAPKVKETAPVIPDTPAPRATPEAQSATLRSARSIPPPSIPGPRLEERVASPKASPAIKETAPLVPAASVSAPASRVAREAEEPVWAQEVAIVKPRATPKPTPAPGRSAVRSELEATRASLAKVPIPEVVVTRTLWHPLSDRRSATVRVNGEEVSRQMVEGDSVGGLVLLKIEPSGVVFVHDGAQIQRRVGQ